MNDLLIILAISNLIAEQKISRDLLLKIFDIENYLNWNRVKRFIWDLISCWVCLSFHVGWIYSLSNGGDLTESILTGLVAMLGADIIMKMKR